MIKENINFIAQNSCRRRFRYLSGSLDAIVCAYIVRGVFEPGGFSIFNIVQAVLFLYGVYLLGLQILNNSKNSFKLGRIVYVLTLLAAFYSLLTFLRGLSFEFTSLFTLLGNPSLGGLFWLLPLCIYIGKQPGVLQSLLPSFKKHAIIGLVITSFALFEVFVLNHSYVSRTAIFSRELAYTGLELLYGAPIVLLTGIAPSLKLKLFYRGCLVFTVLAAIATEQRFYIAFASIYIVLDLVTSNSKTYISVVKRLAFFFITAGAAITYLLINYFIMLYQGGDFVDTRSFLVEEVLLDFDLHDVVFGRGALGTYFSPYFHIAQIYGNGGDSPIRQTAEIGYLFVLLKSGVIGIISYVSVFALSIAVAIRSNKSRAALGIILIIGLHLIEMMVSGSPTIYPIRVVLWILAGVLLSRNKLPEYV